MRLADVDGDGRADLLVSRVALSGYYPGKAGHTWGRFQPYGRNRPTFTVSDHRLRLLDVNGDARIDALADTGDSYLLYEGRGKQGWTDRPRVIKQQRDDPTVPDAPLADSRVHLADMTGDGIMDLIRVFKHHLEYWPSAGVGRWDVRQVLFIPGDTPERFAPERCLLTDVNGDGLTDLVYIDYDHIYLWINNGGAELSKAVRVRYPPPVDPVTVRTADMLGTGSAGILFSLNYQPGQREAYRFLDFTGGTKPYLLNRIDNGVGGITEIQYGSSTAHRLRDRDTGRDWNTVLPRAVQVVNEVNHLDLVTKQSKRLRYLYRDGHYSAQERHFVGFGSVTVRDEPSVGTASRNVYTYHLGQEDSNLREPGHARALRGLLIRHEVFAEDPGTELGRALQTQHNVWTVITLMQDLDGRPGSAPPSSAEGRRTQ